MNGRTHRQCQRGTICALLLCLTAQTAVSEEGSLTALARDTETIVDEQHRYLSQKVLGLAEAINNLLIRPFRKDEDESELMRKFYGDIQSAYDVEGTYIRITPRATIAEEADNVYKVDFRVRLRLSDISDRLKFFVDSYDTDHDTMEEVFSDRYRQELEDNRSEGASAGLTYLLTDRVKHQISLSGGLRFRPAPSPKLRLRAKVRKSFDVWSIEFSQSVFWDREDGFGEKSQFNFDRPIGDIQLFRLTTSAVWSEISQGVDWGQFVSYYATFSKRRSVAIKAGARGHTHPSTVTDQYLVRVPYRQRIHRDWLFIVIEPGLDFFREDNFEMSPLINLKIDIFFGTVKPT